MPEYGKKAQAKVRKVMEEFKEGKLTSGRSGKKVSSRKQAIAIGLSEAREEGAKVPPPKKAGKKSAAARKAPAKKKTGKKTAKKKSAKKHSRKNKGARKKPAGKKRAASR